MSSGKKELGTAGTPTGTRAEHTPSYWCTFIAVSSAILLASSIIYAGQYDGKGDYSIVVAAFGLGVSLAMLVWYKLIAGLTVGDNSALRKPFLSMPLLGPLNLELVIATLLAIWYIVAASILTFEGPHLQTGNGYFAVWGGAFAGFGYMASASGRSVRASLLHGTGALNSLTVPSIVLIIALTKEDCQRLGCQSFLDTDRYYEEAALGLSVGIISLAFIIILGFMSRCKDDVDGTAKEAAVWTPKVFSLVMLGLWIASFVVMTFLEPFTATGNGYFANLIGLLLAFAFAVQQFPEFDIIEQEETP